MSHFGLQPAALFAVLVTLLELAASALILSGFYRWLGALALAVNTRFRALELADILGRGRADWLVFWPGFKGIDFAGILDGVAPESLTRLQGIVAVSETDAQTDVQADAQTDA
ncbi:DoxX family membrane protein, partial [Escherichia coli]|uniref:DoxX family protein n=1 Tax=Escherichia coli TaxID=562 RepID=UPI0022841C3A